MFGTVWAFGRWKPADGVVRLVLAPLAISVFGMVAEVGSETGLATQLVQLEGAGMFAMLGLTAAWILWVASAGPRREAGISAPPPTLDRHGYESQRAD